jgi:hypothetical protein
VVVVVAVVVVLGAADVVGARLDPYCPCVNGRQITGFSGCRQSSAGAFAIAASMKRRQIVAGKVPPWTEAPCTFSIGISPCG